MAEQKPSHAAPAAGVTQCPPPLLPLSPITCHRTLQPDRLTMHPTPAPPPPHRRSLGRSVGRWISCAHATIIQRRLEAAGGGTQFEPCAACLGTEGARYIRKANRDMPHGEGTEASGTRTHLQCLPSIVLQHGNVVTKRSAMQLFCPPDLYTTNEILCNKP